MINDKLLKQAINVLKSSNEKHYEDSSKKKPLLEDEKEITVYLQISLKKIPKCKSIQMIKVNLPHSLLKDNSEVCLIVGDLDKRNHKAEIEPDILHYKELLKKHNINCVSEVLTLRQLRTEYKPYEAKQKLLAAYDIFLADSRIIECLPRVLGRHFFKKRKLPIRVTMNAPNLKQQVEKALSTKVFYLTGRGNSCNSEVAHLDMNNAEISENVLTMAKTFCDKLPGSWENIMGVYLKTALSKAIPVYMSYGNPNEVHLNDPKNDNSYDMDELSTLTDGLVKVYKDGSVRTVRNKKTIENETEIDETADDNKGTENRRKKTKHISDDMADCLTNPDLNEKAVKVSKKSKNKKKEESTVEQLTDKSESGKLKRKSKSKKKDEGNLFEEESDKNTCYIDVKGNSLETSMESKDQKNSLENVLIDEASYSETKDCVPNINKKSKNRKSMKNIPVKEDETPADTKLNALDENSKISKKSASRGKIEKNSAVKAEEKVIATEIKEELPKVIRKSKRKREESILSDANRSLTYSPVQAIKKKKVEKNLKRLHPVKKSNKDKQKKKHLL